MPRLTDRSSPGDATGPANNGPLGDTTALITGASSGIGAATARVLDERGARLVLLARRREQLEELAGSLRGDPYVLVLDLAEADAHMRAIEALRDREIQLDALISCAGRSSLSRSTSLDRESFDAHLDVNTRAPVLMACAMVGTDVGSRLRSIVNVSSIAGLGSAPHQTAYAASKAAVDGATRTLAAEWGRRGIRVNSVAPGVVETDMTGPIWSDPSWHASVAERIPLGRLGSVEEIARTIAFLASAESSYITGQTLVVDGGLMNAYQLAP